MTDRSTAPKSFITDKLEVNGKQVDFLSRPVSGTYTTHWAVILNEDLDSFLDDSSNFYKEQREAYERARQMQTAKKALKEALDAANKIEHTVKKLYETLGIITEELNNANT